MSRQADLGDGPLCPESPMHGRTYIIPIGDGREACWCPVTMSRFALVGGHDAGPRLTRPQPPAYNARSAATTAAATSEART